MSSERPFSYTIPDVGGIDPRKIGYGGQNKGPDYLPHNARGRDTMGRVFFNTGVLWLGGFGGGAVYGFVEGWRGAASPNTRIRINSVMNAMSRRGSTIGNALGVIAFYHTTAVWVADELKLENITGSPVVTPAFAGFVTGGLYKGTAGPRGAALAAVIGTGVSCAYWFGGSFLYNTVFGRGGRF